jgi:hypothetical protein
VNPLSGPLPVPNLLDPNGEQVNLTRAFLFRSSRPAIRAQARPIARATAYAHLKTATPVPRAYVTVTAWEPVMLDLDLSVERTHRLPGVLKVSPGLSVLANVWMPLSPEVNV